MGNVKSRFKKSNPIRIPNRYFLDRVAIDLDQIIAIHLGQRYHLSGPTWYIIYYTQNNQSISGRENVDRRLIERRLSLAHSCLNQWKVHRIGLLCGERRNKKPEVENNKEKTKKSFVII